MKAMVNDKIRMRWSKSVTTEKGVTRTVEVRQIHNGFIASVEQYGNTDHEYFTREIFFEENPLKDVEPEVDSKMLLDFLNPPKQIL